MDSPSDIPSIAILVGTSSDWGRHLVRGVLSYVEEHDPWQVWVQPNAIGVFESLPEGWNGDGVIARVESESLASELVATGLPVVNVSDCPAAAFSSPVVRTDDDALAQMAVDHFVSRGFRNVAVLGQTFKPASIWLMDIFRKHALEQGVSCGVYLKAFDEPELEASLTEWLYSLPKPVGVLVCGHNLGRIVVECCRKAGISVPHDVAVLTGNDDELMCHACFPALSAVKSPTEPIGYKAAEMLAAMLAGEKIAHKTTYISPVGIKNRLSTDTLAVSDPHLAQVVAYLQKHACESIVVDDILKSVPMARRALERKFSKAFGRSVTDEIRRLRINKARTLLVETNWPMQLVAEGCGYGTYNYLTTTFKRVTGMTPSEYRKLFRRG